MPLRSGRCAQGLEAAGAAIADLVTADRLLAMVALDEAPRVAADPKRQKKVDAELAKGKPDKAIDKYKKAWKHAIHAAKEAAKQKGHGDDDNDDGDDNDND